MCFFGLEGAEKQICSWFLWIEAPNWMDETLLNWRVVGLR